MQQHYLTQRMEADAHRRDLEREAARQTLIAQAARDEAIYPLDADDPAAFQYATRPTARAGFAAILRLIIGVWPEEAAPQPDVPQEKQPATGSGTVANTSC